MYITFSIVPSTYSLVGRCAGCLCGLLLLFLYLYILLLFRMHPCICRLGLSAMQLWPAPFFALSLSRSRFLSLFLCRALCLSPGVSFPSPSNRHASPVTQPQGDYCVLLYRTVLAGCQTNKQASAAGAPGGCCAGIHGCPPGGKAHMGPLPSWFR